MKHIMHLMFLSCLKATELIEKRLHFRLSLRERWQLNMHKSMCDACRKYENQSAFIEMQLGAHQHTETIEISNDELKAKIKSRIK